MDDDGVFKLAAHFEVLLEAAPDAMVIADARGRIALVNAQAERMFGYTRDELLGRLIEALIPSRFRAAHRGHRAGWLDPRARPMGAGGLELFGLRKDGTEFPVDIPLRRAPVFLRDIVEEAVEEERSQAEVKGLGLRVSAPEGLPPVLTDPRFVRVVVSNLVGNAVKFTEAGGVEVSIGAGEGAQRISVRDSGPGIPEADQARIFEPFEQRDPVHMKHLPGVGLGLALVREICAALGGRVELRSAPGAGSTFTVVLPLAAEERPGLGLGAPSASL
ncbi:MAG TPA: PAS domain-containing sensor histidine kinase [Anaeromyxobacter sp.]